MPAYCRETQRSKVSSNFSLCFLLPFRVKDRQTGTHRDFRRSEKLEQSLQRSQRGRLDVNSFLLQFDGAQRLFELTHQLVLKTPEPVSPLGVPESKQSALTLETGFVCVCYPQDGDFIVLVSHQQGEPGQRFLQVFTQNLDTLRRRHLLVLLVLALHKPINQSINQSIRQIFPD